MDVAAAAEEAPAMTTTVAGMTGDVIMTAPAEWKAVFPEVRGCLKRRNVTTDRAGLLPGTREEREDITIIPAFPAMSPAAAMRIRLI